MKVVENDTDRRAEVHLYADGIVDPLDEYGEYVDPIDNAICCFVPVRPDQKIRVDGKFYGTVGTFFISRRGVTNCFYRSSIFSMISSLTAYVESHHHLSAK
jgi:hypothetical protein